MRGRRALEMLRWVEGRLAPEAAARLGASSRAWRERTELARGHAAARHLAGPVELPAQRAAVIEAALRTAAAARRPAGRGRAAWALAAGLIAVVSGALLLAGWDPGLELREGPGEATPLERAALRLHEQLGSGELRLELATASPVAARQFVQQRTGLDARLVESRPADQAGRYALQGVALTRVESSLAAAVAYQIDGTPALLLTVRSGESAGAPAHWTPFGRELRHRRSGSRRLLSWTNSGQTYVLVSEQPGYGQQSCAICHAGPERPLLVERAAESL